jgi:1,4-dihydroxy-6-naphthoate synthase
MSEKVAVARSPDAADAFMLYGLASGRVETRGLDIEHRLRDIEGLNLLVINGEADVSSASIRVLDKVATDYALLPHGLCAGAGRGPCVVSREPLAPEEIRGRTVAVPGQLTSAYLALRLFQPDIDVRFVRFDEVVGYVADGFADAGVVIHEGQLTYAWDGLHLVLDLGEWWFEETGLPLPLYGKFARRALGDAVLVDVCRCVRDSIEYAFAHRAEAREYASRFAGGLKSELLDEYLRTFVGEHAVDVGDIGRRAVREFLERGFQAGLVATVPRETFFEY